MRQWTGSALVQVMAWRLFGAKPLHEPVLAYCQLHSWEQISMKFESEFCNFHQRKRIWNCRLPKWWPCCPGRDELRMLERGMFAFWGCLLIWHWMIPGCSTSKLNFTNDERKLNWLSLILSLILWYGLYGPNVCCPKKAINSITHSPTLEYLPLFWEAAHMLYVVGDSFT